MLDLKRRLFYTGQLVLFFSGLFLLAIGASISSWWQAIPFNFGITFIATSVIAFFNKWLMANDSSNLLRKWGLKEIYEHRHEKNRRINDYIINSATKLDIMTQNSLKELRKNIGKQLEMRLGNGLEMRILIPSDINDPQHTRDIEDLINWCKNLGKKQRQKIEIRSYAGTPQDLYYRVDNMIFVGPYFLGRRSNQLTITYEFTNKNFGKMYSEYFEQIWEAYKDNKVKL